MKPSPDDTIQDGKDFLRANFSKGTECPCCGQFVKLYKRKLNAGMARTLINMYKAADERIEWVHHTDFRTESYDYPYLKVWKLIEEKEHDPEDTVKKSSGFWRLTDKGLDFVLDQATVKSHIQMYNQRLYGFDGVEVGIRECLGKKFNYQELMNA